MTALKYPELIEKQEITWQNRQPEPEERGSFKTT
jgi:hypothetical protein